MNFRATLRYWVMVVREIAKSELPSLLRLYAFLHETDAPVPESSAIESVWQSIQANPDHHYFGVFDSGTLVSTCNLTIVPNLTRGCRPYGVIENVVTHPDSRRQGFGKAVLKHALEGAWQKGCYKVMLMTGRLDEATYQFYETAGFDRFAKQAFLAKPPYRQQQ